MEPAQLSLWTLPRQGSTQTLLSPPANQEHRPEQSSPTVLCRGKTYMPQSCHCMEDPLLSGVTSSCHHYGFQLHCFLQSECNTMVMYTHIYTYLHVCVCSAAQSCLTLCHSMDCSPPGPLSLGFSRQEYWSGLPCPPPGDLPSPGIKPSGFLRLLHWQVGSLPLAPPGKPYIPAWMYLKLSIRAPWLAGSTSYSPA